MGSGHWSATTYYDRAGERARGGKDTFGYSEHALRTGHKRAHETLNPFGIRVRESRDSAEHPASNAIIISLDVTGSMGMVVRAIHKNLPKLHELLLGHHYIPHPQILFAAVGDATCDGVPLQVGQFESDNRMDQNLENMILEGGGGTAKTESYELMLYMAARHTSIDCWEKRRHKGYLFMIGDEMAYPQVKRAEIERLVGGGIQSDVSLAEVIEEARKLYEIYFVIPGGASHGADKDVLAFWQHYLGAGRVIQLQEPQDTSQCIGLAIGMNEGRVTLNDAVADLRKHGVEPETIDRVARALLWLPRGGATVQSTGSRRL